MGGRVAEVAHDSGQSVCEHPVKKKLTMPIGSSNQGTIKTLSGNHYWIIKPVQLDYNEPSKSHHDIWQMRVVKEGT